MIEVIVLFVLGFLWVLFASIQDLRSREVANWVVFSLLIFSLGYRFFVSLFSSSTNFSWEILGVLVLGLFTLGSILFALTGHLVFFDRFFPRQKKKPEESGVWPFLVLSLLFLVFILVDLKTSIFVTLFSEVGFSFFHGGVMGAQLFFILGFLFYYSRLFAGGDAKLMIALGPVLGTSLIFVENLSLYLFFIVLFLAIGAVYGFVAMIGISLRDFSSFKKGFLEGYRKQRPSLLAFLALGILMMLGGLFVAFLFWLGVLVFLFPYLVLYARVVDTVCMKKKMKTSELTEGEWLYRGMVVGNKKVEANWEGVSKRDIALLRKKYRYVWVKQGIPFVPVFLIAYCLFVVFWFSGVWRMFF